ncbi:hypothetical protein NPX13_g8553 [Xylaria arbuscula]|uniref:Uncharacterized protein n=1 Tax=Xylaria arbuscula TaxID=114810 RepID=A0A9W8TJQ6_9PEZI|nr:hypothetical protein NPX13_g8553 [Xylaria arbuscula]
MTVKLRSEQNNMLMIWLHEPRVRSRSSSSPTVVGISTLEVSSILSPVTLERDDDGVTILSMASEEAKDCYKVTTLSYSFKAFGAEP